MKKKYKLVAKVPKTPKSSYNHNRFISDLLRQQVHHFHALEKSGLGPDEQPTDISKIKTELHASEYLKKNIMADSMVFSDEGLRHLVAEMGPNQIVYGTDTPFNWPDTLDLIVNAKYLSDAEKEAMLGGNLIKMLKITA